MGLLSKDGIERVLPNGMMPYTHQFDAARAALHNRRTILAFDVGVGKTLTSILTARAYQNLTGGNVAVVAPASLQTNWQRETDGLLDASIHSAGKVPNADDFGTRPFFLIADEAHYYQDPSSKRTQKMIALSRAAQGCMMLTATPIRNYPANLFPLLKIAHHPLGNNFEAYKRRFCDGKFAGSSNLKSLHGQIQNSIIMGSKEEYLDLPKFTRIQHKVEFWGAAKILFEDAMRKSREEYRQRIKSGEISEGGFHIVLLNHLRQAAAKGKSMYAAELAMKALANGHQVVIFTGYKSSARYLERYVDGRMQYEAHLLDGSVPKSKRQGLVDDFQNGDAQVFIMTKAGSAGLNLQKGTVFISVDRTWSPFDMIQAEGRIHRNGQNNPCYSIWLQDEVIDPWLDHMMLRKYRVAREVLMGRHETMDGIGDPGSWAKDLSRFLFEYKET